MVGNDLIDDPLQHQWGKQPEEASGRNADKAGEVKREQRSNLFGEPAEFIRHARRNTAFPHGDRVDSEFSKLRLWKRDCPRQQFALPVRFPVNS
jgi:hypothetical protein